MNVVVALTRVALIRFLRERSNLFFVFVFPMLIVLVVGTTFGGPRTPVIALVDGGAPELVTALESVLDANGAIETRRLQHDAGLDAVAAGSVAAAVIVPGGADAATAAGPATIGYVSRPGTGGEQVRSIVRDAVERLAIRSRVVAGLETLGVPPATAEAAAAAEPDLLVPDVVMEVAAGGATPTFEGLGQFDLGAAQQLALFTFVTALAASAGLIQMREWGIARRLQAAPVDSGQVVLGLAIGRWAVALFQALYIMLATVLLFGVRWGSFVPAFLLVALFAAVAAAAGLLAGAVMRNQAQASGLSVFIGLATAAVGGCMLPLEIMPETLRTIAHVTPHAWTLDGFADVVRRGAGVVDILPELGVLASWVVVLLGLARWRLRVATARA